MFYGIDIPPTASRKEIIDNELNVISERKMLAKQSVIKLPPHHLVVMYDGTGISTESDNGKETNLRLATGELFTYSSYEGEWTNIDNLETIFDEETTENIIKSSMEIEKLFSKIER